MPTGIEMLEWIDLPVFLYIRYYFDMAITFEECVLCSDRIFPFGKNTLCVLIGNRNVPLNNAAKKEEINCVGSNVCIFYCVRFLLRILHV